MKTWSLFGVIILIWGNNKYTNAIYLMNYAVAGYKHYTGRCNIIMLMNNKSKDDKQLWALLMPSPLLFERGLLLCAMCRPADGTLTWAPTAVLVSALSIRNINLRWYLFSTIWRYPPALKMLNMKCWGSGVEWSSNSQEQ